MLQGDAVDARRTRAKTGAISTGAVFAICDDTFRLLQNQDDTAPLRVEDLPPALHHRFVGVNGKFLLQVYPKNDVWQRANQERFVAELRTVDPNVTGTPVQLLEYETLLKNSYIQAAWYSLAAIALMVLFHFRSFGAVILALLPVGIGTLWLAGLMGWFDIPINLANIMTLPLVIGIGVTNGIHILNRFAEERHAGHFVAQHRQSRAGVGVDGHRGIRQFDPRQASRHPQSGLRDVRRNRDVHDCGADFFAGAAEFAWSLAAVDKN